jgi:hypothetical protein
VAGREQEGCRGDAQIMGDVLRRLVAGEGQLV